MTENKPVYEIQAKTETCARCSAMLIFVTTVSFWLFVFSHVPFFLYAAFIAAGVSIFAGVVGLFRIFTSGRKLEGVGLAVLGIVFHLFICTAAYGVILTHQVAERIMCGMNLSSLGHAIMIYTNDNDEQYPDPEHWCDLLITEEDVSPKILICGGETDRRVGESSYAMNGNLKGKKISDVHYDIVLLFDTDYGNDRNGEMIRADERGSIDANNTRAGNEVRKDKWNQHGGPEILTLNHHGGKGCNVYFAGGYCNWVKAKDIKNLKWVAEKPNKKSTE